MGLMAGVTGKPAGMICRHYLGKAFGLGTIGFVTTGAYQRRIQLWRCNGGGIVSVAGQGPVAGLAGHDHMLALLLLIYDVAMADLTGIMAGEGYRPGRCLGDRSPAIVPVLAKAARNDGGAEHDKRDHRDGYDYSEPDEMFQVLEQVPIPAPDSRRDLRAKLRNILGYLVFLAGTMIEVTGTCDGRHDETCFCGTDTPFGRLRAGLPSLLTLVLKCREFRHQNTNTKINGSGQEWPLHKLRLSKNKTASLTGSSGWRL